MVATTAIVPAAMASTLARPSPTAARLVEVFLAGKSERTLRAYRQHLEDFRVFLKAETLDVAAEVFLGRGHGPAHEVALDYRADLLRRGLTPKTVNCRIGALRSLVKVGRLLGLVAFVLEVPDLPTAAYRDTRGPGRDGVRRLLDVLETRVDAKAARDRALIRCLYDLGLRRAEAVSLDVDHLDLDAGVVSIMGKARREREVLTLPASTVSALRAWLAHRGEEPGALFLNFDRACKGARLTGAGLYAMLKNLGASVGLVVRPHGLRHSAITAALDATGGDVRRVQRFSRHRDLRVLTVYDDARRDMAGEVANLVAETL
jgi:integrase/recombinase XerC